MFDALIIGHQRSASALWKARRASGDCWAEGVIPIPSASDSSLGFPAFSSSVAIAVPPIAADPDTIPLPPGLELEEAERRYARAMLERLDGNQSAAARALNISRNKLARLLRG